jgi:ubiquinone/menaquinone biosynthesis C-methylase UbiE
MAQEWFLEPPMPDVIEQWRFYFKQLNFQPNDVVLDVGCNTGDTEHFLVNLYPYIDKVVGLDNSEKRIERAKQKWEERGKPNKIEFILGDGGGLPFEDETFDKIVCAETLEWIKDPLKAIQEIKRVLRPNGIAVIQHTDWDSTIFTASDLNLTRQIIQKFGDSGPDGIIGRKLLGLCKQSGFKNVTPKVYTLINDKFDESYYSYKVAKMILDWITAKKLMTEEELKRWFSDLKSKSLENEFFFSVNRNLVVCSK